MTLSASSVLHYWSSRYGINPRIGGRPVFTRNSAGLFTSQEGEVDSAIINTPRFDWATLNLPNSLTERRKLLTLEFARTNNMLYASDLTNAAWVKSNASVAFGYPDPSGGNGASRITATAATGDVRQNLAAGSSIQRINSLYLRRVTGTGVVSVINPDAGGVTSVVLTSSWQRFNSAVPAASTVRLLGCQIATSGDVVDWWLGTQEDATFSTAGIQTTTAAAARAADSCYWNFPPVPQAMMVYVRFVEQGTILLIGAERILEISSATDANARFLIYNSSPYYTAYHVPVSTAVSSTLAAAPAIGDTVELLAILFADGSVQIIQSINAATVTAGPQSAAQALAGAWADSRLYLNSIGGSGTGANKFAELKIVKYADVVATTAEGRMDELRAFEIGPNQDVL